MTEFKGSKTEKNLLDAFAGESKARNKYTYFGKIARNEGHRYIASIFEMTAENEMRHAKDEFKLLNGIGDTQANLQAAIEGEDYETKTMYVQFAKDADEEGFKDAANLFRQIAKIEAHHRDRYRRLLEMLQNGTLYTRETPVVWTCDACGWSIESKEAPPKCPCCKESREHFVPSDIL
jgi:rubrerythrin